MLSRAGFFIIMLTMVTAWSVGRPQKFFRAEVVGDSNDTEDEDDKSDPCERWFPCFNMGKCQTKGLDYKCECYTDYFKEDKRKDEKVCSKVKSKCKEASCPKKQCNDLWGGGHWCYETDDKLDPVYAAFDPDAISGHPYFIYIFMVPWEKRREAIRLVDTGYVGFDTGEGTRMQISLLDLKNISRQQILDHYDLSKNVMFFQSTAVRTFIHRRRMARYSAWTYHMLLFYTYHSKDVDLKVNFYVNENKNKAIVNMKAQVHVLDDPEECSPNVSIIGCSGHAAGFFEQSEPIFWDYREGHTFRPQIASKCAKENSTLRIVWVTHDIIRNITTGFHEDFAIKGTWPKSKMDPVDTWQNVPALFVPPQYDHSAIELFVYESVDAADIKNKISFYNSVQCQINSYPREPIIVVWGGISRIHARGDPLVVDIRNSFMPWMENPYYWPNNTELKHWMYWRICLEIPLKEVQYNDSRDMEYLEKKLNKSCRTPRYVFHEHYNMNWHRNYSSYILTKTLVTNWMFNDDWYYKDFYVLREFNGYYTRDLAKSWSEFRQYVLEDEIPSINEYGNPRGVLSPDFLTDDMSRVTEFNISIRVQYSNVYTEKFHNAPYYIKMRRNRVIKVKLIDGSGLPLLNVRCLRNCGMGGPWNETGAKDKYNTYYEDSTETTLVPNAGIGDDLMIDITLPVVMIVECIERCLPEFKNTTAYKWEIFSGISTGNNTLRPVQINWKKNQSPQNSHILILNPFTLSRGQRYTFRATPNVREAKEAHAEFISEINGGFKKTGKCDFKPQSGVSGVTLFEITCSGFKKNYVVSNLNYEFYQVQHYPNGTIDELLLEWTFHSAVKYIQLATTGLEMMNNLKMVVLDTFGMNITVIKELKLKILNETELKEYATDKKKPHSLPLRANAKDVAGTVRLASALIDAIAIPESSLTEDQRQEYMDYIINALSQLDTACIESVSQVNGVLKKLARVLHDYVTMQSGIFLAQLYAKIGRQMKKYSTYYWAKKHKVTNEIIVALDGLAPLMIAMADLKFEEKVSNETFDVYDDLRKIDDIFEAKTYSEAAYEAVTSIGISQLNRLVETEEVKEAKDDYFYHCWVNWTGEHIKEHGDNVVKLIWEYNPKTPELIGFQILRFPSDIFWWSSYYQHMRINSHLLFLYLEKKTYKKSTGDSVESLNAPAKFIFNITKEKVKIREVKGNFLKYGKDAEFANKVQIYRFAMKPGQHLMVNFTDVGSEPVKVIFLVNKVPTKDDFKKKFFTVGSTVNLTADELKDTRALEWDTTYRKSATTTKKTTTANRLTTPKGPFPPKKPLPPNILIPQKRPLPPKRLIPPKRPGRTAVTKSEDKLHNDHLMRLNNDDMSESEDSKYEEVNTYESDNGSADSSADDVNIIEYRIPVEDEGGDEDYSGEEEEVNDSDEGEEEEEGSYIEDEVDGTEEEEEEDDDSGVGLVYDSESDSDYFLSDNNGNLRDLYAINPNEKYEGEEAKEESVYTKDDAKYETGEYTSEEEDDSTEEEEEEVEETFREDINYIEMRAKAAGPKKEEKDDLNSTYILGYDKTPTVKNDSWVYMGILPYKKELEKKTPFSFKALSSSCQEWMGDRWRLSRCKFNTSSKPWFITCNCDKTYFRIFSAASYTAKGSFYIPPESSDFVASGPGRLKVYDIDCLATLIILFLMFLGMVVWALFRDLDDKGKRLVIVLPDNFSNDRYGYLVTVYTGSHKNSGTSSNIGIQLIGFEDISKRHLLESEKSRVLQDGSTDWFMVYTPSSLGDIAKIHVWSNAQGHKQAWYCSHIVVRDLQLQKAWTFMVERWLSLAKGDGLIKFHLKPTHKRVIYQKKRRFVRNMIYFGAEGHMWFNIFTNHPRSFYTRMERIAVCAFGTFFNIFLIVFLYRTFIPSSETILYGITKLGPMHFLLAFACSCCCLPSTFIFSTLFRKSCPFSLRLVKSDKQQVKIDDIDRFSYFDVEKTGRLKGYHIIWFYLLPTDPLCESHRPFEKRVKSFKPPKETCKKHKFKKKVKLHYHASYFFLHVAFRILAWCLCVLGIFFLIGLSIFYTMDKKDLNSIEWLCTVLLMISLSIFVIEPIKVCITAFVATYIVKVEPMDYDMQRGYPLLPQQDTFREDRHVTLRRALQDYAPVNTWYIPELRARERARLNHYSKTIEILFIILFALVVFCSVYTYIEEQQECYLDHEHLGDLFAGGWDNGTLFKNVKEVKDIYDYLDDTFLPLFKISEDSKDPDEMLADDVNRMIGMPRLRQLRIINDVECPGLPAQEYLSCFKPFSTSASDKKTYYMGWSLVNPPAEMYSERAREQYWKYRNHTQTKSIALQGESSVFPGGGYIADLGRYVYNMNLTILYLKRHSWMDDFTSVVVLELVLYNSNHGHLTVVNIIFEKDITGFLIINHYVKTIDLHTYPVTDLLIMEIAFALVVCGIIFYQITALQIYPFRRNYRNWWNIFDLFLSFAALTAVSLYLIRRTKAVHMFYHIDMHDENQYLSIIEVYIVNEIFMRCIAILIFLTTVRIVKIFLNLYWFRTLEITLYYEIMAVIFITVIMLILLLACSVTAFIALGFKIRAFRTPITGFGTVMAQLFGMNQKTFSVYEEWFIQMVFGIIVAIRILIVNLYRAVLLEAYTIAKMLKKRKYNYGFCDYFKEEYKYHCKCRRRMTKMKTERLRGGSDVADDSIIGRRGVSSTQMRVTPFSSMYRARWMLVGRNKRIPFNVTHADPNRRQSDQDKPKENIDGRNESVENLRNLIQTVTKKENVKETRARLSMKTVGTVLTQLKRDLSEKYQTDVGEGEG